MLHENIMPKPEDLLKGDALGMWKHLLTDENPVSQHCAVCLSFFTGTYSWFSGTGLLQNKYVSNKLEEYARYFGEQRGWRTVRQVPEDQLCKAFVQDDDDDGLLSKTTASASLLKPPEKKPGVSMMMPGAFAAQFQCSCIRCGR